VVVVKVAIANSPEPLVVVRLGAVLQHLVEPL
jgi:hypothetical protein